VVSRVALADHGVLRLQHYLAAGDEEGPKRVIAALPSPSRQVDCPSYVLSVLAHTPLTPEGEEHRVCFIPLFGGRSHACFIPCWTDPLPDKPLALRAEYECLRAPRCRTLRPR